MGLFHNLCSTKKKTHERDLIFCIVKVFFEIKEGLSDDGSGSAGACLALLCVAIFVQGNSVIGQSRRLSVSPWSGRLKSFPLSTFRY